MRGNVGRVLVEAGSERTYPALDAYVQSPDQPDGRSPHWVVEAVGQKAADRAQAVVTLLEQTAQGSQCDCASAEAGGHADRSEPNAASIRLRRQLRRAHAKRDERLSE